MKASDFGVGDATKYIPGTEAPTERQPEHPHLWKGHPKFVKGGPSPNASGKSKYLAKLERMIRKQEKPELVCEVVAAMREDACAHEKFSPAAAKVYFSVVAPNISREPPVDLKGVSEEALREITAALRQ